MSVAGEQGTSLSKWPKSKLTVLPVDQAVISVIQMDFFMFIFQILPLLQNHLSCSYSLRERR